MIADVLTARVALEKRRLLAGGLLQEVEWGIPGEPDVRGRRTFTYTPLDALIEQRPALDRGTLSTDRADNTVLTIFDPAGNHRRTHCSDGANRRTRLLGQSRRWDCGRTRKPARDTPPKSP